MANNRMKKETEKQRANHMDEPLKKHGDKMDLRKLRESRKGRASSVGGAGEPQATPLEPEEQGGIGGP
jgi:hypothetical protein